MTEKIQKAIDKLDKEADELGGGQYMLVASHIIDNCLTSDENAEKVIDEKKTLKACMEYCAGKAKNQKTGNFAMVEGTTVFGWVKDYYEFSDLQSTAGNKRINLFDVI